MSANRLNSDFLVAQILEPSVQDAQTMLERTGEPVAFHSIAAYHPSEVPGAIESYRKGVENLVARFGGALSLNAVDAGPEGVEAALERYDIANGGQLGGMMYMIPDADRSREAARSARVPIPMDIDGSTGAGIYRAPTATAMRAIAEHAIGEPLVDAGKRMKIAIIGTGRTTGSPLLEDLHEWDVDPLVITLKNQEKRHLLNEADIIFTAVGYPTVGSENVKPGAIVIDAGVRVDADGMSRGDIDPAIYDRLDVRFTRVHHGVGQLTTMIAVSNAVEAATRKKRFKITPRSLDLPNDRQLVAA